MTLEEFLKLKLPIYSNMDEREDPQRFIDGIEKACEALKFSGWRTIELTTFQFQEGIYEKLPDW